VTRSVAILGNQLLRFIVHSSLSNCSAQPFLSEAKVGGRIGRAIMCIQKIHCFRHQHERTLDGSSYILSTRHTHPRSELTDGDAYHI
jgi:hypothetical protein